MSHIEVDLKVIEVHAPMVARACGLPLPHILGSLNLLWHRCWSTKTDTISRIGLAGVFGPESLDVAITAMVDSGFLEPQDDVWRVKGAGKYLRIREGNSKGGKAASGNLKRGTAKPVGSRGGAGDTAGGGAGEEPGKVPGQTPALPPNTEHRTPNTEEERLLSPSATPVKVPAESTIFAEPLRRLWNELRPRECPEWLPSAKKRDKSATARLREQPDLEVWRGAIQRIARSDFLRGRTGGTWKANPDWLVQPDTLTKILEGKYDGAAAPKGSVIHGQTHWTQDDADNAAARLFGETQ